MDVREENQPVLEFLDTANGLRLMQAFARIQDKNCSTFSWSWLGKPRAEIKNKSPHARVID